MGRWLNGAQVRKREIDGKDTRIAALAAAGAVQAQAAKAEPIATVGIFADGFEPWEAGKSYAQYDLFSYDGKVGFCRQAVTAMAHQPPFSTGMEAIYGVRPIPDADGVYPYVYNMAATVGMKVRDGGVVYVCKQAIDPMLWPPSQVAAHFDLEEATNNG